jgi:hypothetical protein
MHGDLSPEARLRADRTVEVASIFADNADVIVAELPYVADGFVLVAVVDHEHSFAGTHHVDRERIVETVPELEGAGGWAMVFSPGTTVDDVRRRTAELADLARQRGETIDRILARRAER